MKYLCVVIFNITVVHCTECNPGCVQSGARLESVAARVRHYWWVVPSHPTASGAATVPTGTLPSAFHSQHVQIHGVCLPFTAPQRLVTFYIMGPTERFGNIMLCCLIDNSN